ncbi:MAG TPA: ergothioneine biosynthesis protein EgtC [Myxococcales bacterium]|nr:ergothioneine biosynthesis protein EgtC [Myxococcales bacterium]
MAGYVGPALPVAEIVSAPPHSLLVQSYKPREMQSGTVNADGYGAALWLDDGKPEPALYRTAAPIWADANQQWMGERLRARSVIAAVRSATPGIGFELANVQPFARGRLAFAHNGFITDFRRGAQRSLREGLGEAAYEAMEGTSDSEHIFALVHDASGTLAERVAAALRRLEQLDRTVVATLLLGDGEQLVGVRWARGAKPATLYLARWGGGACIASEPLDPAREWKPLPEGEIVAVRP